MGFHYIEKCSIGGNEIVLFDEANYEVANLTYIIHNDTVYIQYLSASTTRARHYVGRHFGTQIFNIFLQKLEADYSQVCKITGILSNAFIGSWLHSISYYYALQKNSVSKAAHKLKFHLYNYEFNEVFLMDKKDERLFQIKQFIAMHEAVNESASFYFEILNISDNI